LIDDAEVHHHQSSSTDGTLISSFGELNLNADVIAFPEQERPEYEVADGRIGSICFGSGGSGLRVETRIINDLSDFEYLVEKRLFPSYTPWNTLLAPSSS
jgi:hypothetical protein